METTSTHPPLATYYDAIYLSPHLDDAVLSCGGQIYQRTTAGEAILIVSVAAGDPALEQISGYAQSLHDRWELVADAVAARRGEDIVAAKQVGAHWYHWDLPDCIYRVHPETGAPFYTSDPDIFGPVHPAERLLVDRLATQLRALPTHGQMVVPLTLGNHVDHMLTRQAAEQAFSPHTLWYYEDYPYAQAPGALDQVLPSDRVGWEATTISLSPAAVQRKIDAIGAFVSQLSTFFRDDADLAEQIRTFTATVGGERLWRQQPGD